MRPHDDRGGFLKHARHKITAAGKPLQCFALLACLVDASKGHDRQATYHSQRFLAAELGVSAATIGRWAQALVAAGVLDMTVHKAYPDPETGLFRRLCTKYRPKWSVREAMARVIAAKAQVTPKTADGSSTPLPGGRTRRSQRWRGSKPPAPPVCTECETTNGWIETAYREWRRCPCHDGSTPPN